MEVQWIIFLSKEKKTKITNWEDDIWYVTK